LRLFVHRFTEGAPPIRRRCTFVVPSQTSRSHSYSWQHAGVTADLRIVIRVKPGAARPKVGGRYGDGELVVAVAQRPVEGAANEAVRSAVAKAFGVAPREISIISGATARTKVLSIHGDAEALRERRDELLGSP
jgi:uncharacterized protein YggU (UPF0235/DUF167 family)